MRFATQIILVSLVVLLGLWELMVLAAGESEALISPVAYDAARRWPILTLALGVILGHLLWPQRTKQ
jgi:hypothetical protein